MALTRAKILQFSVYNPLVLSKCWTTKAASSVVGSSLKGKKPGKWGYRRPAPCDVCYVGPLKKPCFDIKKLVIERGCACHSNHIRSFLNNQYWPREPTVVGLWMPLTSEYLKILTEKYANTGDRFLAFERIERTGELRMVGVAVGHQYMPWRVNELEAWAHSVDSVSEKQRLYFMAHMIKSANLFEKYKVPYCYEIEVLCSAQEIAGHGVGHQLLRRAIIEAFDVKQPVAYVIATSTYAAKCCEKCRMKKEFTLKYSDFVDFCGRSIFYPRRPHLHASVYAKAFDCDPFKFERCP